MTGLRQLRWTGTTLPEALVQHLADHPQLSLHLSLHATDHQTHLPGRLARLNLLNQLPTMLSPALQNLTSLRLNLTYTSPPLCRTLLQTSLKTLLLSTPSLRSLSLNISYSPPEGGIDPTDAWKQYCGFGLTGDDAPPCRLESLEVLAYPFGMVAGAIPGFEDHVDLFANIDKYPNRAPETEDWAERFDWSRLRRLRMHPGCGTLFSALAPRLEAVEEVEFIRPRGGERNPVRALEAVTGYAALLPETARLRVFSTPRMYPFEDGFLLGHIAPHAATLRELVVYATPVDAKDVGRLRWVLPGLEKVSVVCRREGGRWPDEVGWPEGVFAALAGFGKLRELEVWFDVGSGKEVVLPGVTAETAREVAGTIWKLKREVEAGGGLLRKVTVRSGSVARRTIRAFGIGEVVGWMEDHEVGFECVWREGEAGEGVEVRCLGLSDVQNGRLREIVAARAAGEKGDMTDEERDNIRFVMALDGPMTMDDWRDWKKARE